jgi:hypothetical protein
MSKKSTVPLQSITGTLSPGVGPSSTAAHTKPRAPAVETPRDSGGMATGTTTGGNYEQGNVPNLHVAPAEKP